MDKFERIKTQINIADAVTAFGIKLNGQDKALCPFHNEKTPSFSIEREKNIYHCFGCGAGGDAVDYVSRLKGMSPVEAVDLLADMFSLEIGGGYKSNDEIRKYILTCKANIAMTDYFVQRGFTAETIERFNLGYDTLRNVVIIPYSSNLIYYIARSITEKKFFKPPSKSAGSEPLFNANALDNAAKSPVIAVEGPICAMSVHQSGGQSVALCGTGGGKLTAYLKKRKAKPVIILCLDNDAPRRKASSDLAAELYKLAVPHIEYNIADECKDPNELLIKDPIRLRANIEKALAAAAEIRESIAASISAYALQKAKLEEPRWLVEDMLPQGLAIISAPSKTGKSWMMLQLCLAVSQGQDFLNNKTLKSDCWYLALEDSQLRLKDRINKILGWHDAPDNLYFSIHAGSLDNGLIDQFKSELNVHPNIKLIVIDTLQKIRDKAVRQRRLLGSVRFLLTPTTVGESSMVA